MTGVTLHPDAWTQPKNPINYGSVNSKGARLNALIRFRYNTMSNETPGGEWKWRAILEKDNQFEEVLVKQLLVNVPSFSREDEMPVVGRKYHMACYGAFRVHAWSDSTRTCASDPYQIELADQIREDDCAVAGHGGLGQ